MKNILLFRNFLITSGSRTPLADVGYIYRAVVEMYWGCKSLQCADGQTELKFKIVF